MLQQKGFIFMPDISGFTQFVNSVELEHSRHIIAELPGFLIESNPIRLKISEVEGDAILFYSLGEIPDLRDILQLHSSIHNHSFANSFTAFLQTVSFL